MSRVTDATKKIITETALNMFVSRSISKVRLYDIAANADVGEATIYRHFGNKQTLVLASAIELSNQISNTYLINNEDLTGFELIKKFYEIFLEIFKTNIRYYSFINELDSYLAEEDFEGREAYEDNIEKYKEKFFFAYNKGIKDGTIRQIEDAETFYYSTTHSTISLCKKLSSKKILKQDDYVDKEKEIKILVDLFLEYLKK